MPFLAPLGVAAAGLATSVGASAGLAAGIGSFTTLAAAGGIGFLGLKAITGLTKQPSSSSLTNLPKAPSSQEASVTSRAQTIEEQRSRLRGSKTTLTSPEGLLAQSSTTSGKTLLGA